MCHQCGKASVSKCSRCKQYRYCGRDCQRAHWKAGHKKECGSKHNVNATLEVEVTGAADTTAVPKQNTVTSTTTTTTTTDANTTADTAAAAAATATIAAATATIAAAAAGFEDAAELGAHPAARQLLAYNAPFSSTEKVDAFLGCFSRDVTLYDLRSGAVKLGAAEFRTRYRCVFAHSRDLTATVTKRVVVRRVAAVDADEGSQEKEGKGETGEKGKANPRAAAARTSFAVDFERYAGLIAPTGGALDGSTGMAALAAAAHIVAVYRCDDTTGTIDAMWVAVDTERAGAEGATVADVEASAVYGTAMDLIEAQLGATPGAARGAARGELEVEFQHFA